MSLSNLIEQGSLRGAAKDFFQSWDLPRRNEEEQAAALTNLEQRVEKFIRAADRFWRQDRLLPLIRSRLNEFTLDYGHDLCDPTNWSLLKDVHNPDMKAVVTDLLQEFELPYSFHRTRVYVEKQLGIIHSQLQRTSDRTLLTSSALSQILQGRQSKDN